MEDIISFIAFTPQSSWLILLKIIFGALFLGMASAIVFFVLRTQWIKSLFIQDLVEFFTFRPYGVRRIAKTWAKITARLEAGLESEYKLSVVEADNLLDEILRRIGFAGHTLAERLDLLTSATLPNLDDIREANKTRNNIVHDPDFRLTLDQAKKAIEAYEQALRDLQAL